VYLDLPVLLELRMMQAVLTTGDVQSPSQIIIINKPTPSDLSSTLALPPLNSGRQQPHLERNCQAKDTPSHTKATKL